ncbi:MAG TPA: GNAT family N-acetyltransferase [Ferruginibacter sp.]|nr:GNAT family N-acetyltransferase [Ferruginibacter sp.]
MQVHEVVKDDFIISTNKNKLDVNYIHNYLCNESYWAKNITKSIVKKSIDGSLCFGLYITPGDTNKYNKQVGFARVVTDYATFGYLADVFVDETYRKKGLAKWMMEEIMKHKNLQGLRRWMLATRDAHTLYAKFGFLPLDKPERIMGFKPFEEYPKGNS